MSTPDHDLEQALSALAHGQAGQARALAERGLARAPAHPGWRVALALALSQLGEAAAALPHYEVLVVAEPTVPEHWSNLANCLCELGREAEALAPVERAQALGAADAGTWFAAARALAAHGRSSEALLAIDRALAFDDGDPEFRLLRARLLLSLDDWEAANAEIDTLRRDALTPPQQIEAGYVLMQAGFFDDAVAAFGAARAAAPGDVDAALGLAMAHERRNQLDAARALRDAVNAGLASTSPALRDKALQLDARLAARDGDHAAAERALRDLLAAAPSDPALVANLGFDLGRACDAQGAVDAAVEAFTVAHAARRRLIADNHPALVRSDSLMAVLREVTPAANPALAATAPVDNATDPVFLVGFPRSGTTLLEQLLDAHPALVSFDEQPFLQRLVLRVNAMGAPYPAALAALAPAARDALRRQYFAEVARVAPAATGRRAVDKNPLNMTRLPLVEALFPAARVLLAVRHPCDVVLSCWMQSFRAPAFAVTFETLTSTARMYDAVMRHYVDVAAARRLPVHVLRYEDLVNDVAGEGRRLFAFLGLDWHDELLGFTERAQARGAISTPSYAQVVQPVNRRAVGRWARYQQHFGDEALNLLAPWIAHWGYAG